MTSAGTYCQVCGTEREGMTPKLTTLPGSITTGGQKTTLFACDPCRTRLTETPETPDGS